MAIAGKSSRRGFLRQAAQVSLGLTVAGGGPLLAADSRSGTADSDPMSSGMSRVVMGSDVASVSHGKVDESRVRALLDESMCHLLDTETADQAWRAVASPSDVVGIKVNCLAGPLLSTRVELVSAMVSGLVSAGLDTSRIIVWERTGRELKRAGYTSGKLPDGTVIAGTDSRGAGYEREVSVYGKVGGCLSRILTRHVTVLISVGALKDHGIAGLSGSMKNLYGVIHNPNKYHGNSCDPYVADLCSLPELRGKLRLSVLDALYAQSNGGPAYVEAWRWPASSILVSRDPVAVDAVGLSLVEDQRKSRGLPTLAEAGREPTYLQTASGEDYRLGRSRMEHIDLCRIGGS